MSGLEVLGAIASSLELVKVAKSCLSTFNDLRRADIQEKEQKELQFHFIVQGLKFDRWCSSLGIQGMFDLSESDAKQWTRLNQVAAFEGVLQSQLRFKNHDLARLILSILKDINRKFSDAEVILAKYSETSHAVMVSAPTSSKSKLSRGWNKFSRKSKEEPVPSGNISASDVSISKQSVGKQLYTGVHWVTSDKSTITQLLEGVKNINHSLVELLQSTMQNQVSRQTDLAVLDSVSHHTTSIAQSLPEGSDIRALASMRQWQVREQKEPDSDVSSTGSARSGTTLVDDTKPKTYRSNTYSPQDFKRNTLKIGDSRSISVLNGESVVIEWKYYTKSHPFRIEQSFRLTDLVRLLNQNELYRKFQALPCRGLVSDIENSRVGIVFTTGASSTTKAKTLQDVIRSRPTPPPVGERFTMAERLALSIHNLHSVQWLHKGIHSDNIICFEEPKDDKPKEAINGLNPTSETDIVAERSEKTSSSHLKEAPNPLPSLYLLGWDLSRPDHPSELSESISISTLGFLSRKEMIQMYTHPEAMPTGSLSAKRARYRPQFDIYSLGLILLELGLWRTLDTIRHGCKTDEEFRTRVRTDYCDKLQAKMGLVYWRAVQRCLNDDFDVVEEGFPDTGDYSLQVGFEKYVVCELEKCFA